MLRRRFFWILLLVLLGAAVVTGLILSRFFKHTSAARPSDRYAGEIAQLYSSVDRDGDGLDDQSDILEGALAYVATCPVYESKYYAGGYPDDGCGVCTDVVAAALKAAGYDLRSLVAEDVAAAPEAYQIETPDANIDYRRVRNLKVYFVRHAVNLTLDLSDLSAWQGGDVVIFQNHIGIISDRRNKAGVPYVIHHNDAFQFRYEEDILESRKDIVGHYRVSE